MGSAAAPAIAGVRNSRPGRRVARRRVVCRSRATCLAAGVHSHLGRRGRYRTLCPVECERRAIAGFRADRACERCDAAPRLLSPRPGDGVARARRPFRAVAAGVGRGIDLRRVGLRVAGHGSADGERDCRARLPAGHGRRGDLCGAGARGESRGRSRAAARRSTAARMSGRGRLPGGWASGLLVALALFVVLVPLASHQDPLAIGDVLALKLVPPLSRDAHGAFHLLGTDRFGRDLFVRMMLAGRISLAVGVIGSLLAGALGTAVGALAAWTGGAVDWALMALADALLALPRLVLLLVCAALWQPGLGTVVVVLVATGWMGVARMIRAELLGVVQRPFVESATALGAPSMRVLLRHALPNSL